MIRHFSHFGVLCCIFSFGYLCGKFSLNQPKKITTSTQTNSVTTQENKVATQLNTKKDVSTVKFSNYTEKFFNDKGLLTHEISYGNQTSASSIESTKLWQTTENVKNETSKTNTTTIQEFRSTLFLGLGLPTSFIKEPKNIVTKFEDINFIAEYRPWDRISVIGEVNYKLTSRLAFTYAVN